MLVRKYSRIFILLPIVGATVSAFAQAAPAQKPTVRVPYLKLTTPRRVLPEAQAWEGNEFPHTMSVLEMKRGGFRYWGWYGLNEGRGIGLARTLYFAITRDYDTPSSHIVLASSDDGIHLKEEKILVQGVPNQRNQNPNLFRDPRSGRFYLTFYRGNDRDHFEIISKNANSVQELDAAPEKVLMTTTDTVAAPTLLYLRNAKDGSGKKAGVYFLATEIYPHRYSTDPEGEWQVKVFAAAAPDGDFQEVEGNPVMRGQRACLFQHVFNGRFYGYDCHLEAPDRWVLEEVEAPLP
jgi:hypothetical protein